jgi:F-type H+-transporting ATPase subunit b
MNSIILLSDTGGFQPLFGINPDTIVFSLINTLLIMAAYYFFLHKPVMAMFDKRKDAINAELDEATLAKGKAEATEKKYLELLAHSKAEADRIVTAANAKAREREEEIITSAESSAKQIKQKAQDDIERERKRATNEIKDQISEIVIMAASAVAEKEINEQDNAKLIESFLATAEA